MKSKDSSTAAERSLHAYWLQTVLDDRAESAPPPATVNNKEARMATTEHMWLSDFICAGSRAEAFLVADMMTRSVVDDEAVLGLLPHAETDRGAVIGLERAVAAIGMSSLSWLWRAYAADAPELANVAAQGIEIIKATRLPGATVAEALAHLRVWRKMSAAKLASGTTLDVFAISRMQWRAELPRVGEDDTRPRSCFRAPVNMLFANRWDQAIVGFHTETFEMLDPSDRPLLPDDISEMDRDEIRERIRVLVDVLFGVGTVDAGELALGWLMLLCDPALPSSFQQCVPQIQRLFDAAVLDDADKLKGQARLNVWWSAAAGKLEHHTTSIFWIASRDERKDDDMKGFGSARKTTAKLDPVPEKPQAVPGRSVIVMPSALGSKLNNYHEAFKPLVDVPLPLVIVSDLARIRRTLHAEYPHATAAVDLLLRDLREGKPFYVKPMLLVGNAGSGKSRLIRRLCELAGVTTYRVDGAGSSDNMFAGTSKGWGNTEASVPARAIAQSKSASPLVMIDEIEKAGSHRSGSLHAAILPFLDGETAARYRDQSLDWQLDLSHVSYVATANDIEPLSSPLRDRFRIIRVPDPTLAHLLQLANNVLRELIAEDEAREHEAALADDELEVIGRAWSRAGMSMRKLQKIVAATLDARDQHAMRH